MRKCTWHHLDIVDQETYDKAFAQVCSDLDHAIVGGFDTETTGLHHIYNKPFLYQFGFVSKDMEGYTYTVDLEQTPQLARRAITLWQIYAKQLPYYVGHNVKFDLHMLLNIDLPYTETNISDTMVYIRLGSDAVPTRKGGAPMGLKAFAKQYIDNSAKDMDSKLQEERTKTSSEYNRQLKKALGWTKKQIDSFFNDKLNTWQDLPEDKRDAYRTWHDSLPTYLKHITSSVTSDDIPYNKLNRKNVTYYGHLDIVWTLEAWLLLAGIIEVRGNQEALARENANIYPLLRMERVGFKIDYEYLINCKDNMRAYMLKRRQDFCSLAGEELKASQSVRILEILNTQLGVKVDSTNADALDRITADLKHSNSNPNAVEFIETLQELRTLEKWYSTYIMRFIKDYKKEDGKIYTTINQAGTVSGRVTSDFQQFPKDGVSTLDGVELFHPRRMVQARDGDFECIVYLDYSQVELRLQAFYTILVGHPDENLCRAYMPYKCKRHTPTGWHTFDYKDPNDVEHSYDVDWYYLEEPDKKWQALDVHGATTKIAFGITEDDPQFHALRYKGKRVNFAKNYGAQYNKIKEMFPEYDEEQVHRIDDAYYQAFPGVKEYHNYCYALANTNAYASNMFGVKYYNASGHNLINMLVQGTGAYFLKQKVVEVDRYLREHHCKSELMMQIHDELQFKKHKDDDPQIFFDIKRIMESWHESYVPIVADMEITYDTWADKYEVTKKEEYK